MRHGINAFATGARAISPFPSKAAKAGNIQQITNITNNKIINLIMNSFPLHYWYGTGISKSFHKLKKIAKKYSRKIREHDSYAFRKTDRRHDMLLVSLSFLYLLFQFLIGNVQQQHLSVVFFIILPIFSKINYFSI